MARTGESITWQLRTSSLTAGRIPLLMGIVNVTPDSFSDGGKYFGHSAAVDHGLRLAREGADILDVGGQSTRPGAMPIDAREELRRVLPVIERLTLEAKKPVSVDTSSAVVAREALAMGAEAINDVTALTGDAEMLAVVSDARCGACIMHMQGTPQSMQIAPQYQDVCSEVRSFLAQRRDALVAAGVEPCRIAVDPGIGFGKTLEHNLELLRNLDSFRSLGHPVMVGLSRKAFIGSLLGDLAIDRTYGTVGAAVAAALAGANILRVHDIAAVRQA